MRCLDSILYVTGRDALRVEPHIIHRKFHEARIDLMCRRAAVESHAEKIVLIDHHHPFVESRVAIDALFKAVEIVGVEKFLETLAAFDQVKFIVDTIVERKREWHQERKTLLRKPTKNTKRCFKGEGIAETNDSRLITSFGRRDVHIKSVNDVFGSAVKEYNIAITEVFIDPDLECVEAVVIVFTKDES